GCSENLSARVQHMFLRALPIQDHSEPWAVPSLIAGNTDRSILTAYLANQTKKDGADLVEWLLRSAVHLPAALSPGFGEGLDPMLRDVEGLLRSPFDELSTVVSPVGRAIAAWLTA